MSNDIDLRDGSTGIETEIDVEYPGGIVETVEPDYDMIVAQDPESELECPLDETRTCRLEYAEYRFKDRNGIAKADVQEAIAAAWDSFLLEYGYEDADVCVEHVYIRTVGGEQALCVQLRGDADAQPTLSRFALTVDEMLLDRF